MVFEFGDDDGVTLTECAATQDIGAAVIAEGVGHQIQCLGGVLGEHDLVGGGTDETGNALPGAS